MNFAGEVSCRILAQRALLMLALVTPTLANAQTLQQMFGYPDPNPPRFQTWNGRLSIACIEDERQTGLGGKYTAVLERISVDPAYFATVSVTRVENCEGMTSLREDLAIPAAGEPLCTVRYFAPPGNAFDCDGTPQQSRRSLQIRGVVEVLSGSGIVGLLTPYFYVMTYERTDAAGQMIFKVEQLTYAVMPRGLERVTARKNEYVTLSSTPGVLQHILVDALTGEFVSGELNMNYSDGYLRIKPAAAGERQLMVLDLASKTADYFTLAVSE